MQSMAAAHEAHTNAPPDQATQDDGGGWFATAWTWTADVVPGGNLTLVGAVLAVAILAHQSSGSRPRRGHDGWREADRAFEAIVKALFTGIGKTIVGLARFYTGYELRRPEEPRSTATFLRAGTPTAPTHPQALKSVAFAPPKVNLVKPRKHRPSPWARALGKQLRTYKGHGAGALNWAVKAVRWTVRWALKAWGALRAVYGVLAPLVATVARVLGMWHCWPYAARGLTRIALTLAVVGLMVPAWRTGTIVALALGLAGIVALAHKHRPKPPGDADVYGPRLWAILRDDLGLPEDEPRANWLLLPERLAAPDARIVIRLPWTFRGSQPEKDTMTAFINSRLPGDWEGRFTFASEHYTATYTHKRPPKPPAPEPECPATVDFFADDIQEAIASCKVGQVVLGKDQDESIVIRRLDGETPHWALSVGTGGGKSTFNMSVAVQLIAQGYHIIVIDPKRSSVKPLEGIPGVHIYGDPKNPQDMRAAIEWFKDEIDARSYVKDKNENEEFPGLLLLIEEANEFADISKEWWDDNRKTKDDEDGPKDRASDTIWGDVASAARLGRFVRGNILSVFQDLRDQALGGKGLRNLFRLKFMGNYTVNQWKNVIGTTPVPESIDEAGRMMIVEGNSNRWVQTLYAPGKDLREWAMKHREEQGFDPAAGLFGTAPERSPERMPYLVRFASRDSGPHAALAASEGVLEDETAGRGVTPEGGVTGDVTASRDRLRLIPGRAAAEGTQGSLEPPQLLTLAEIARKMQAEGYAIEAGLMRTHKKRRETTGFPQGVEIDGSEKFTMEQLITFYEGRGLEKQEEGGEEAEQNDAV